MFITSLVTVLSILKYTSAVLAEGSIPKSPNEAHPFLAASPRSPRPLILDLLKRQGTCPSNYSSCSSISAPGVCCPDTTNCARDSAGHVACCPKSYVCTGAISGTTTASGAVSSSATTTQSTGSTSVIVAGTVTVTSTAGVTGTSTVSTTATTTPVTITAGSTIPNIYYPYQYIQTTYTNSAACLAAYSYCQVESTSCYNQLAGQNGVTVSNAIGSGGTTVQGATGLPATSASSICSSLSLTACYGLRASQCSSITGTGGNVIAGAAERTACPGMRYFAGAGIGAVAAAFAI